MELEKIKIIENFLSLEDADKIINYINRNIGAALDWETDGSSPNFVYRPERWYKRRFGQDDSFPFYNPERYISRLEDIEDLIKDTIEKAKVSIEDSFKDTDPIYLSSIWLAKHLKRDWLNLHSDSDGGFQLHFHYSCVLYLNTVNYGGELFFPSFDLHIKPKAGDLVVFLSQGDDMHHSIKMTAEERYTVPMWFTKDSTREISFK